MLDQVGNQNVGFPLTWLIFGIKDVFFFGYKQIHETCALRDENLA